MADKPDILQVAAYPDWDQEVMEEKFTIHRLWEAKDRDAFVAGVADKVTVMAAGGEKGVSRELMEALPNLKLIASYGVGYDNINVEAAKERGLKVTNTPDVLSDEVADMALGLMLGVARDLRGGDAYVRSGRWPKEGAYPFQFPVHGKRAGIIGLGRIGKAIATRCAAFGMEIAYTNRNERTDVPYRFEPDKLKLAEWSDYFIIALVGGDSTKGAVTAEMIEAIGPNGVLVNISRGTTVDEESLIKALQTGKLGRAGLDVFLNEPNADPRFFELDNVLLAPHQASATLETRKAMGKLVIDNMLNHFAGKPLISPIY